MANKLPARIFVILARKAPVGVIFRRGPSKQVQLIKWDTLHDRFEYGQWFKGRIYERRSDLSPEGDKMIYFAANNKKPYRSWTAISKPPYLTALALWPKGDTWGGGGLFRDKQVIFLNHGFPHESNLAPGFKIPFKTHILPLGSPLFLGEDQTVYRTRLLRDGWKLVEEGKPIEHHFDSPSMIWITYNPPITYEKKAGDFILQMQIKGIKETNGPWYVVEYKVIGKGDRGPFVLSKMDWADWDKNDDLLFAGYGKLFRMKQDSICEFDLGKAVELADFNNLKFEEKVAPREALIW
jgi:hypothetical protein